MTVLDPETFWPAARRVSERALASGALQPIATRVSFVEDHGVEFVVRVSDNLWRKQSAPTTYRRPRGTNPFLPTDPALTVGSLAPDHVAVLNKFNVLPNHVLVVTRRFVHQETALTAGDFAAVAPGLAGGGSLAFYNAGRAAGASQAHKHFQLVPLPLGRSDGIPTAVLFDDAEDGIDTVGTLPFRHAFTRLTADAGDAPAFGRACHALYTSALSGLSLAEADDSEGVRLPPYNLLLTDQWLFVCPRRREHFREISVNGLGYAGSLFVSTPAKLAQVRATGPIEILLDVSIPSR